MDIADEAQDLTDLELDLALKNLKQEHVLQATGSCYYCDDYVDSGLFCDSDCRDDYEVMLRNK